MKAPNRIRAYTIILSSILLLINIGVKGQDKKVALGLGISPTVNWMKTSSNGIGSDGTKLGFSYGLLTDFNFGENYALATGIFINNFGGKTIETYGNTSGNPYNVNYNYKFQSILIPITLRMRTNEIGYLKYYGQFGFNPELIINSKADISFTIFENTI